MLHIKGCCPSVEAGRGRGNGFALRRRVIVSDAGEGNDRAGLTIGRVAGEATADGDVSASLSKRAARRRRRRRAGAAGGDAAERALVGNAPTAEDRPPERVTDPITRIPASRTPSRRAQASRAPSSRTRESVPADATGAAVPLPFSPSALPSSPASGREGAPSDEAARKGRRQGQRRRRRRPVGKEALRGVRKPGRESSEAGAESAGRPADVELRRAGHGGAPVAGEGREAGQGGRHGQGEGRRRHGLARARPGETLYAALDLGTNNCRLLVAEPQERGFRVVDAYSRIVRLGEGISRTGRLSEAAMDRAVEALAVCQSKLAELRVRRMRLIATEACRLAENGPLFLERVRRETGLDLEIVSRETEARLAVAGCATLVDGQSEGVLLFDIGGGSSELVWLDLRNRGEARGAALTRFIAKWTSLPVGVVTLSERHGGHQVTPETYAGMVEEVSRLIAPFEGMEGAAELVASGRAHMLGTSGTVTTLAGIHLGLRRYDRRRVDGVWLGGDEVDAMIHRLIDMGYDQRVANPCIGADRADLVLAGCAILTAIRAKWPCERLRVADRGLREGILVELMARDGVWRRRHHGGTRSEHG